jgi:hypothetical protein
VTSDGLSLSALVGVGFSPLGPRVVPRVLDDLIGVAALVGPPPLVHESDPLAAASANATVAPKPAARRRVVVLVTPPIID